jgi:hypothetical protein
VLHKHGDLLYAGVTECVTQKLHTISKVVHSATVERLLEVIVREWEQHKLIMTMIRDILMYMVCCSTSASASAGASASASDCMIPGADIIRCNICVHAVSITGQDLLPNSEESTGVRYGSIVVP